jgi:hypothetical protein
MPARQRTEEKPLPRLKLGRSDIGGWLIMAVLAGWAAAMPQSAEAAGESVYTIGNYPVEATGASAVAAKREAISDGRRAAFRSLLKRLVPVTAYQRIKAVQDLDPAELIAIIAVKSEKSSRTRYIASLDFTFAPDAVRQALRRRSVPFVDEQAAETMIIALYSAPPPGAAGVSADMGASEGARMWSTVWSDLDLANSVAPLKLRRHTPRLHVDAIKAVAAGDFSAMRILESEYGAPRVLLAIAEPDVAAKRLNVVLAGRDAVGTFALKRRFRYDPDDFPYALELAAVISQGIVEGRWKAVKAPQMAGSAAAGGPAEAVDVWVEFSDLAQWRNRQQLLQDLPGVENFQTGGLSVDGASVQLRFPGGGAGLRDALASRGLTLVPHNGAWILQ